jgi:ribosomal protein S18 acetylase RimI-like enzyme
MYFELTPALLDNLIFCMEDQGNSFLFDMENLLVVDKSSIGGGGESHFIDIPEWDSAAGFHLMERFAAGFKNTVVRDALTATLERGKGVFRAFKDTLSRYPEAEQRWFAFKEREMRRRVIQWYNALRESWNMERIGDEPEETEDLILEDFMCRGYKAQDCETVTALHNLCGMEQPLGEPVFVMETVHGDFAGFIAVIRENKNLTVSSLAVRPEYRGLGIASELCSRLLEYAASENITTLSIDLPASAEGFSRFLFRSSFKPVLTRYCKRADSKPSL